MDKLNKKIIFAISFLFLIFLPLCSYAESSINVSPTIIDKKGESGDILEFTLKIDNKKDKKVELFTIVNEISILDGKKEIVEPTLLDKSVSLFRWIQINRGVLELEPGESEVIPLTVNINPFAKAGKYYAVITFSQGSTREEANERALKLNQPQVMVNIEVEEHIVEKLQIIKFETEEKFYFNPLAKFFLEIKNIGNSEVRPKGFISIYNKRGQELKSIEINENKYDILANGTKIFENEWQIDKGFGQYKANLELEYGNGRKELNDVIYFWIIPWKGLALAAGGLLILFMASKLTKRKVKKKSAKKTSHKKTVDLRP